METKVHITTPSSIAMQLSFATLNNVINSKNQTPKMQLYKSVIYNEPPKKHLHQNKHKNQISTLHTLKGWRLMLKMLDINHLNEMGHEIPAKWVLDRRS